MASRRTRASKVSFAFYPYFPLNSAQIDGWVDGLKMVDSQGPTRADVAVADRTRP